MQPRFYLSGAVNQTGVNDKGIPTVGSLPKVDNLVT